ncbi:pilin [Microtetraspora niveoalba]|uniref:pilin n=1 Tax=Microtetraspora niveoalba TaxID=46175 RepID=UPI00082B79AA|nr:pilin [Microtetraspora niveoalba]
MRSNPGTTRQVLTNVGTVAAGAALGFIIGTGITWLISDPSTATASTALAAPSSLNQVIDNLRNVIVGLLVALATLFLTIGGVRYILAGGDPSEVEAAKKTLRYAGLGYGIATLAPLLVSILKGIVGG